MYETACPKEMNSVPISVEKCTIICWLTTNLNPSDIS